MYLTQSTPAVQTKTRCSYKPELFLIQTVDPQDEKAWIVLHTWIKIQREL